MARILFLQRDGYEAFGPMYLSSALKVRGHSCDVMVQIEEGRGFLDAVCASKPDVVGFSIMSGLHEWAASIAREVKARLDVPIIAGGTHCTFFPEFLDEPGIDAICRGEAEDALPDYLDALEGGEDGSAVPGFSVKTASGVVTNDLYPLRSNLDEILPPDRDLYAKRYPGLAAGTGAEVMAARGCPYNCSFCYNKMLRQLYHGKGTYVRRHSPERLLAEIKALREKRGNNLRYLAFVDDLFVQDRKWLESFLALYARHVGLPYMSGLRANLADEEMVALLAKSGCGMVSFGVESGDEQLRNTVLAKRISEEQIVSTARLLTKYGIRFSTFNMFNLPGETLEKALMTLRLNQRLGSMNYPWSGLLQPYRGTGVHGIALDMGLVSRDESGARLFHSPTIRQRDTDVLERFNAYFYWMVRYPLLESILLPLTRRGLPLLEKAALLSASFHRYASLYRPFEGRRAPLMALKAGFKRLKSYL
jgi:radical SAM superfamily enzyme YgiQ (UPF0313 family)